MQHMANCISGSLYNMGKHVEFFTWCVDKYVNAVTHIFLHKLHTNSLTFSSLCFKMYTMFQKYNYSFQLHSLSANTCDFVVLVTMTFLDDFSCGCNILMNTQVNTEDFIQCNYTSYHTYFIHLK